MGRINYLPAMQSVIDSMASKMSSTRRSAMRGALGRIRLTSLRRPALHRAAGEPNRSSR